MRIDKEEFHIILGEEEAVESVSTCPLEDTSLDQRRQLSNVRRRLTSGAQPRCPTAVVLYRTSLLRNLKLRVTKQMVVKYAGYCIVYIYVS
jgi:hypothetical protein